MIHVAKDKRLTYHMYVMVCSMRDAILFIVSVAEAPRNVII